jgi:hypothetical protein
MHCDNSAKNSVSSVNFADASASNELYNAVLHIELSGEWHWNVPRFIGEKGAAR